MRTVKVVQEGESWYVQVIEGERTQQFTCATEVQALALSRMMGAAAIEKPPRR